MSTIAVGITRRVHTKKWLLLGLLLGGMLTNFHSYEGKGDRLPQTELGKLVYLLNFYQDKEVKVIFDGQTYDTPVALQKARRLLRVYYKGEEARAWIQTHLYRSPRERKIIYLAFPDGSRRPLRDVLMEELEKLFPR